MGWVPGTDAERARYCIVKERWNELARMGSAAVPYMLSALTDDQASIRLGVTEAFWKMGGPGIEALLRARKSSDARIRAAAADALAAIRKRADGYQAKGSGAGAAMPAPSADSRTGPRAERPLCEPDVRDDSPADRAAGYREFVPPTGGADALPGEDPAALAARAAECARALADPDENIRIAAVEALKALGDAATDYIVAALSDSHYAVRCAAAETLGVIGDKRTLPFLITAVGDPDEEVRTAAAHALGALGDSRAVPALVGLFLDPSGNVRIAAAEALAAIGSAAVEPVIAVLDHDEAPVRRAAAEALGGIADPQAVVPLARRLADDAEEVRRSAVRALARIGPPSVKPLAAILKAGSGPAVFAALEALSCIDDDMAREAIAEAGSHPDPAVRRKASELLARQGGGDRTASGEAAGRVYTPDPREQELDALIQALRSADRGTQFRASEHLIRIGRPAVDVLIRALRSEDRTLSTAAAEVLSEMGEAALDGLIAALHDSPALVRLFVVRNLGKIADERSVHTLVRVLADDDDARIRAAAAESLGYMGAVHAVEPLLDALHDRDEKVRMAATRSLGYIGDVRAAEPLIQQLEYGDYYVCSVVTEALKNIGAPAAKLLAAALTDGNREFSGRVAEALDAVGWEPADDTERANYLIAKGRWNELDRIGPAALAPLARAMHDPDMEVRMGAINAIVKIGGDAVVDLLIDALRDDYFMVRKRAANALIGIGKPAIRPLRRALEDGDPQFQALAQGIIDSISRASGA